MLRNSENTVMFVNEPDELPNNIKTFYDFLGSKDNVTQVDSAGNDHICVKNAGGQIGLFSRQYFVSNGEMFLPSCENAPLFVKGPTGGIVVIAPCEMPEFLIVGGV